MATLVRVLLVSVVLALAGTVALAGETAWITEWQLPSGGSPGYIAQDASGNIWYTDEFSAKVARFDPTTNTLSQWQDPSPFRNFGITVDGVGNVWYAVHSRALMRLTVATNTFQTFDIPTNFPGPFMVDADGCCVYFTNYNRNTIGRLDTATAALKEWPIPSAVSQPEDILVSPDGNTVWFGENNPGKITRLNATTGTFTEWAIPSPGTLRLHLVLDPSNPNVIWFTKYGASRVCRATLSGNNLTISEWAIPGAGANNAYDLDIDSSGKLWVTEYTSNKIVRFDPSLQGPTATNTVGGASSTPTPINSTSNVINWGVETPVNTVLPPSPSYVDSVAAPGAFTEWGVPTAASGPSAIVVDRGPQGPAYQYKYFTEFDNNKLARWGLNTPPGTNVQVCSPDGLTCVTFPNVTTGGQTFFTQMTPIQSTFFLGQNQNNTCGASYDITTSASYTTPVQIAIRYTALTCSTFECDKEHLFKLWHVVGGVPTQLTTINANPQDGDGLLCNPYTLSCGNNPSQHCDRVDGGYFVANSPSLSPFFIGFFYPGADAGPDKRVCAGANVTIGETPEPQFIDLPAYSWTQTAGTPVTLSNPSNPTPSLTAPAAPETLTFEVTAVDPFDGSTTTDTVDIVVVPNDPGCVEEIILPPPPPPGAPETTFTGVVTESNGGLVSGARITARLSNTAQEVGSTTTDTTGRYSITVPTGAFYDLIIGAPEGSGLAGAPVTFINANAPSVTVNFTLVASPVSTPTPPVPSAATITGTIYTTAGDLAPGVQIRIRRPSDNVLLLTATSANPAATFSFTLAPGVYNLNVLTWVGTGNSTGPGKVPRNSSERRLITNFTVLESVQQDLFIPVIKRTARVRDEAGNGIADVLVHLGPGYSAGTLPTDATLTRSDGTVEVALFDPVFANLSNTTFTWNFISAASTGRAHKQVRLTYGVAPDVVYRPGRTWSARIVTRETPAVWLPTPNKPPYGISSAGGYVYARFWTNTNYFLTLNSQGRPNGLTPDTQLIHTADANGGYSYLLDPDTDYVHAWWVQGFQARPSLYGDYPQGFWTMPGYLNGAVTTTSTIIRVANNSNAGDITLPTSFISGQVRNRVSGAPVPGARVQNAGTLNIVTADANGYYYYPARTGHNGNFIVTAPAGGSTTFNSINTSTDRTQDFEIDTFVNVSGRILGVDGTTGLGNFTIRFYTDNLSAFFPGAGATSVNPTGAFSTQVPAGFYRLYLSRGFQGVLLPKEKAPHYTLLDVDTEYTPFGVRVFGTKLLDLTQNVSNFNVVIPSEEIVGRVIDSNAIPVNNATITLFRPDGTSVLSQTRSIVDGSYHLPFLPHYLRIDRDPTTTGNQFLAWADRLFVPTPPHPEFDLHYFTADYNRLTVVPPTGSNLGSATLPHGTLGEFRATFQQNFIMKTIDTIPPVFTLLPTVIARTDTTGTVRFATNEETRATVNVGYQGQPLTLTAVTDPNLRITHTVTIPGLTPSTTYDLRVTITDDAANPTTSGIVSFTTLSGPDTEPPALVSDVVATNITDTQATIVWRTDEFSTSIASYATTPARDLSASAVGLAADHSVQLTGLTPDTVYYFSGTSCDSATPNPNCATYLPLFYTTFRTLAQPETTPPLILTGPTVTAIANTSAVIAWTTDEAATSAVTARNAASTQFVTPSDATLVTQHTMVLTGLTPATQYFYRVTSSDAAGNQAISAEKTFTTTSAADTTAPSITSLSVVYLSPTIALANFTTNEVTTGTLEYTVGFDTFTLQSTSIGTFHQVQVSGLPPEQVTPFTVFARDLAGNGPDSEPGVFDTRNLQGDITGPVVISGPTAAPTETTARIQWGTDEVSTSRVNYQVGLGLDYPDLTLVRLDGIFTQSHDVVLTNLLPCHDYSYAVQSVDPSGNSSVSQIATFRTLDATPPVVNAGADITVEATSAAGAPGSAVAFAATATDASTLPVTLTSNAPAQYPIGTTIVTFTGQDACGNIGTDTVNVIVRDSTPPTIACPANVTAQCDAPGGVMVASLAAFLGGATASDTVDPNPTITNDAPSLFPSGQTTTVTFVARDASNNSRSCQATVAVVDTTAPIAPALPDVVGECSGAPVEVAPPTANDTCAGAITGATNDPLVYTARGIYTITWTFDDGAGNSTIATQRVVVGDTTPPVPYVDPLPAITAECSAVIATAPTATDACAGQVTGTTSSPLSYSAAGTYTITWTYDDQQGNTSTQAQQVIITDATAPTIACPVDITRCTDAGQATATINPGAATATDNCSGFTIASTPLPAAYPLGTTTITWTATDPSGNSSSCTQTITVTDCENPVITCAENITVQTTDPNGAAATYDAPTATDNVGVASLLRIAGPASGSNFQVGTTTITYRATDAAGNSADCSFTVTVVLFQVDTCSLGTNLLWPPNHRLEPVTVSWSISGNLGHPVTVDLVLSSSQADDAAGKGDGMSVGDLNGVPASDPLAEPHSLTIANVAGSSTTIQLRAERQGSLLDCRYYTVKVRATDTVTGNVVDCTHYVHVPHDMNPEHPCVCGGVDCPFAAN